tara:strand:- start:165 stop:743 length:579 start_codon:yes stop_codon:yes gene_type:complete
MRAYKVVTPATTNPITLTEAKTHLKVDTTADDTFITNLIKSATSSAQEYTNRFFITTTIQQYGDKWEDISNLFKSPVLSVSHIKYVDPDGTLQTLSTNVYFVDEVNKPARIGLKPNQSFPTIIDRLNAVYVEYRVGTAAGPDEVDEGIRQALLLTIGNWYQNRQAVVTGTIATELPMNAKFLLDQYKIQVCR